MQCIGDPQHKCSLRCLDAGPAMTPLLMMQASLAALCLWISRSWRLVWTPLQALSFAMQVSTAFGLELPATATFDYPTVAALAAFVASRHSAPPAAQAADIQRVQQVTVPLVRYACMCLSSCILLSRA